MFWPSHNSFPFLFIDWLIWFIKKKDKLWDEVLINWMFLNKVSWWVSLFVVWRSAAITNHQSTILFKEWVIERLAMRPEHHQTHQKTSNSQQKTKQNQINFHFSFLVEKWVDCFCWFVFFGLPRFPWCGVALFCFIAQQKSINEMLSSLSFFAFIPQRQLHSLSFFSASLINWVCLFVCLPFAEHGALQRP